MVLQREVRRLQPRQKFICSLMNVLQYLRHYTLQKLGNNLLMTLILFLNVRTWKSFSITSTTFIKILSLLWRRAMEEENNRELAFLDILLKRNNGKITVLVHRKFRYTDQYLHYSSHHQTSCKEYDVSSLFNRTYSIITNKYDLYKENATISKC